VFPIPLDIGSFGKFQRINGVPVVSFAGKRHGLSRLTIGQAVGALFTQSPQNLRDIVLLIISGRLAVDKVLQLIFRDGRGEP
jgi:hypothetical protein